ncbi:MAG: DNA polymerase III subunit gamma/tau, partial [Cyanobacteria bacterium J06638_6]
CLNSEVPTPDPCGECQVCREITVGASLDVVEIDAASNTGVDNIRELIERAQFAPVQCRHKLYVLDEVHMLSTAAFNALLKTLEEPPPQVVFVLATTDPQRVLPTIISRCQRFDFRRIPLDAMVQHLDYIARQESIAIAPDALQLVAQLSQGGLRDAESLLDQLGLLEGEITIEAVWDLVGAVSERDLLALIQAISADDGAQVLVLVRQLLDLGREPLIVLQSLVAFYRDLLIAKTADNRRDLVAITPTVWREMIAFAQALPLPLLLASQQHLRAAEVQVKNTTQPRLWLEIALMGLLPSAQGQPAAVSITAAVPAPPPVVQSPSVAPLGQQSLEQPLGQPETPSPGTISPPAEVPQETTTASGPILPKEDTTPASPPVEKSAEAPAMGSLSDIWVKIVAQLRPMGTQVLMRQHGQLMACDGVEARVGITNDKLMRMAQDRLSNVETAFEKVFGHQIRVTMAVVTTEQVVAPAPPSAAPAPRPVPKAAVVTAAEPADVKPNHNPIVEPSSDPSPG